MRRAPWLFAALGGVIASCAHRPPPPLSLSSDALLGARRTHFGLSSYFLIPAPTCTQVSASSELCGFRLGKNNPGYGELAAQIGSHQKLTVLCALPLPRNEQAEGTCVTHRHDGDELKMKYQNDRSWWNPKRPRSAEQAAFLAELTSRRDVSELSHYFGQAPDQCSLEAPRSTCSWTLTTHTPRYERSMLATRLSEPFHPPRAKLHVLCSLPSDGSSRADNSCLARNGDRPNDVQLF